MRSPRTRCYCAFRLAPPTKTTTPLLMQQKGRRAIALFVEGRRCHSPDSMRVHRARPRLSFVYLGSMAAFAARQSRQRSDPTLTSGLSNGPPQARQRRSFLAGLPRAGSESQFAMAQEVDDPGRTAVAPIFRVASGTKRSIGSASSSAPPMRYAKGGKGLDARAGPAGPAPRSLR
jgi:hypothetical protein